MTGTARNAKFRFIAALSLMAGLAGPALGTEIIYRPINPAFGGDPFYGPALLNEANAQNKFTDPTTQSDPFGRQSALQQFTDTLQRAILSRGSSAISGQVVDSSGNLIPGVFTVGNIQVTVVDLGTTLRISTLDNATGQSTVFEVPK